MRVCAHGAVVSSSFTTEKGQDGKWTVRMDLVYEASGDARFPLTFSVLNAARTRLINVTKGTNTIQDELVLDNPRKNNPFSFIGTDSAQILVRIDGTTLTDTAVFS